MIFIFQGASAFLTNQIGNPTGFWDQCRVGRIFRKVKPVSAAERIVLAQDLKTDFPFQNPKAFIMAVFVFRIVGAWHIVPTKGIIPFLMKAGFGFFLCWRLCSLMPNDPNLRFVAHRNRV